MNRIRGDSYRGPLAPGQRVHSILYGGRDGYIVRRSGEEDPGSVRSLGGGVVMMGAGASYDVAFESHISRMVPECIIRGVQWYIYDEAPSQVDAAIMEARALRAEEEARQKAEEAARQHCEECQGLPVLFPYLFPLGPGQYSTAAHGAKNLRIELKRAFPGVKFSVRSSVYSGGDSIDVSWADGPPLEAVKAISDKYQEGDFDGMNDIYESRRAAWPEVFGGAKYVMEQRRESPALLIRAARALGYVLTPANIGLGGEIICVDYEDARRIYSQARATGAAILAAPAEEPPPADWNDNSDAEGGR
jgi:hypothetical protein